MDVPGIDSTSVDDSDHDDIKLISCKMVKCNRWFNLIFFSSLLLLLLKSSHAFLKTSILVRHVVVPTKSIRLSRFSLSSNNNVRYDDRKGSSCLFMSSDGNTSDLEKKIAGRKKRLIAGYCMSCLLNLISTILLLTKTRFSPFYCYVASGPLVASGISYILIGAAQNDRLSSDTYKRLNLCLGEYAFLLLTWGLLDPRPSDNIFRPLITLITTIKGYGYGVLGWDKKSGNKISTDVIERSKETLKGVISMPKNITAAVYLGATVLVATTKLRKFGEVIRMIQDGSITALLYSIRVSQLTRLALLTCIMYTLKDGADRDRLQGTTFVELNFLSAVLFGTMAVYFNAQGAVSNFVNPLTFFSLFSVWTGSYSIVKKKGKN